MNKFDWIERGMLAVLVVMFMMLAMHGCREPQRVIIDRVVESV